MNQSKLIYRSIVAAAVILFATSCATTQDSDELRNMIEQAQRTADQAQTQAQSAASSASQAERKADEALRKAEEAQACCETNRERMERMFEKSQEK